MTSKIRAFCNGDCCGALSRAVSTSLDQNWCFASLLWQNDHQGSGDRFRYTHGQRTHDVVSLLGNTWGEKGKIHAKVGVAAWQRHEKVLSGWTTWSASREWRWWANSQHWETFLGRPSNLSVSSSMVNNVSLLLERSSARWLLSCAHDTPWHVTPQLRFSVATAGKSFWHLLQGPAVRGQAYRVSPIIIVEWEEKKAFFSRKL